MPNFDIESFKANFKDASRSNLFYFIPNFPGTAVVGDMGNERAIYLVRTTSLPGSSLEEITLNWQGFDFFMGGKHTFQNLTVTFNLDREGKLRMNFENWMNLVHDPVSNKYGYIEEYMLDQKLQLLDLDGSPIMEYTLYHAWPQEIAAATLDYASNEVTQFDVTFRYSYHTITDSPTGL